MRVGGLDATGKDDLHRQSLRPRLVVNYLASLERVRALEPELLITGHGEPVRDKKQIAKVLDTLHGAVSYIRDRTIEGMNAGKSVHELMREIVLPDHLRIGEFHATVRWAVRAIWDENSGWFRYADGTTGLYDVPRSSVHADIVALADASALATKANDHLVAGRRQRHCTSPTSLSIASQATAMH